MRVALFGGSFNPPHVGHVLAASYVLSIADIDKVLVVPVFAHPFDKALAPFGDRLAMCRLAMESMPRVEVSPIEQALAAPSLTLRTVKHLLAENPDWSLRLVVGADLLAEASQWHAFDEVARLAPLLLLGRHGTHAPDGPKALLPDVSSTEVREMLHRRRAPEVDAELAAVVPKAVLRYVDDRGLYR